MHLLGINYKDTTHIKTPLKQNKYYKTQRII